MTRTHPLRGFALGLAAAAAVVVGAGAASHPAAASTGPALPGSAVPDPAVMSPVAGPAAPSSRAPAATSAGSLEGAWSWPVAPPHPVTRPFEMTGPYSPGHRGIDVDVPLGAAIAAPAAGEVRFAGVVADRPVLSLAHDDGTISSFEPVDATVTIGDRVERGQIVGHLSISIVHAPHGGLHLGARLDDVYLNPLLLLGALAPAVLLPLGDAAEAGSEPRVGGRLPGDAPAPSPPTSPPTPQHHTT